MSVFSDRRPEAHRLPQTEHVSDASWRNHAIVCVLCSYVKVCLCVSLYSRDGQVNAEELHKLLAENKQVSGVGRRFRHDAIMWLTCSACEGERDRLVPAAQELGAADDLQREAGAREPEERSLQPSHDLCAADSHQDDTARLHAQDGVLGLHLPQQVALWVYLNIFISACSLALSLNPLQRHIIS